MAKGKSTWKYNKLLTARRNYFTDGGSTTGGGSAFSGLFSNPFKGSGGKAALTGVMGAAGQAIGQIGGKVISGGLESGVGNAISGLSSVASAIPGPWGAVASAGLGIVGGLTNRAFGSKLNQENINAVNNDISTMRATTVDDSSNDSIMGQFGSQSFGMGFNKSFIGKDGWFSKKAKKKYKKLKAEQELARIGLENNYANAADNAADTTNMNLLANYAAFGGPMNFGGGALDYDLANRYLDTKYNQAMGQNNNVAALPNSFGIDTFAYGGDLSTHGADFTNGVTYINNGGTHESNPNEGVPIGTDAEGVPNLVEEGETIFNDYVFSKRLQVPEAIRTKYKLRGTGELSFADASKKLAKESEERPNDPISQRGLEAAMAALTEAQEGLKQQQYGNKFSHGGAMGNLFDGEDPRSNYLNTYGYVKGYNGGWYDSNGRYTQDYLNRVNGLTQEQLQQQFDAQYNYYNDPNVDKNSDQYKAIDKFYKQNSKYNSKGYTVTADDLAWARRLAQDNKPGYMHWFVNEASRQPTTTNTPAPTNAADRYYLRKPKEGGGYDLELIDAPYEGVDATTGMTWAEANPNYVIANGGIGTVRQPVDVEGVPTTFTDYYYDVKTPESTSTEDVDLDRTPPNKLWEGLRYAPAIGLGIASLTDAFGWTNKPDYDNANAVISASTEVANAPMVRWNPIGNYLAYTPLDRNYYLNQLRSSAAASRRSIVNQSGGNRGQAMAGILASDYNTNLGIGNLARQAEEYNLGQREKVETFNRGTNQMNSEGFLKAAMANQDAVLKGRQMSLDATIQGYKMREAARLAAEEAKSANLSGFIESLGNIGRENAARNQRNWAIYSGAFGEIPSEADDLIGYKRGKTKSRAKGGKLNKKKRGLTF